MGTWFCEYAWLGHTARNVVIESASGVITQVTEDAPVPDGATRLKGLTVPGFANAHSHAFHRVLRGRTEMGAGSFWTWRARMYDVASRLDPDSYHRLARAVYGEMALAGVTAVGEFHYLHHGPDGVPYDDPNAMGAALVAAANDAGIRLTFLDTCYLRGGFDAALEGVQARFSDGSAAAWAERVDSFQPGGDVVVGAAIHSVRAVDLEAASDVAAWAHGIQAPLHFHLSEQPDENEACLEATGKTPTRALADVGALGPHATAVHATHLAAGDIALLARSGTSVCLCPTTERQLGDGIGPAAELDAAGVPLAVGSDSHAVIDLLEESRLIELHDRLRTSARGVHAPGDLLDAATIGGARSLGRDDRGLTVGAPADFTAVRLDTVRTAGIDDPVAAVIHASIAEDVTDVVVAGRPIVSGGQHAVLDDVTAELAAAVAPLVG